MSLLTTDAYILRTVPFRDTSLIVTLLLNNGVRYTAIAHGARKLTNTNNAAYQLGNFVRIVLYKKTELNTMGTVSQIQIKEQYPKIKMDYQKMILMQYFLEFVYKNTEDGGENKELYELLHSSLHYLNENKPMQNWKTVWDYHALKALGVQPSISHCIQCGKKINEGNWSVQNGGISCSQHGIKGIPIGADTHKVLQKITFSLIPKENYHIPQNVVNIMDMMMNAYAPGPYHSLHFFQGRAFI